MSKIPPSSKSPLLSARLPPAPDFGDHLALDFLNSTAAPWGEWIEWLGDGQALLIWLEQMDLVAKAEALKHFSPSDFDAAAATARRLRDELRAALKARVDSSLASGHFALLNQILPADNRYSSLELSDGVATEGRHLRWQRPEEVLLPIADAIVDLFTRADFGLVQKCVNPPCTLWFYDTTKSHRRRYCTVNICANRAKVAAHRARQKNAPRPSDEGHQ